MGDLAINREQEAGAMELEDRKEFLKTKSKS